MFAYIIYVPYKNVRTQKGCICHDKQDSFVFDYNGGKLKFDVLNEQTSVLHVPIPHRGLAIIVCDLEMKK